VLEIFDRAGRLVRRFSSDDRTEPLNEKEINVPLYWIRPPRNPSAKAGMQRFVWDLHYPEPKAESHDYPISAIYMDTPRVPLGPVVMPGEYTVKLTIGGRTYTRTLTVELDPRVKTPRAGLQQQFTLSMQVAEGMTASFDALEQIKKLRAQIKDLRARAGIAPALSDALAALDRRAAALVGEGGGARGSARAGAVSSTPNLDQIHGSLAALLDVLQSADVAPTTQGVSASTQLQTQLSAALSSWDGLKRTDFESVNAQLRAANLPALVLQ
jgi:hypothetical protein